MPNKINIPNVLFLSWYLRYFKYYWRGGENKETRLQVMFYETLSSREDRSWVNPAHRVWCYWEQRQRWGAGGRREWVNEPTYSPCALTIQAVLRTVFPRKHHVVSIRLWDGHSALLPRGSRRYMNRSRLWGRDSSVCSWSETGDAELLLVHWTQRHTGT